MKFKKIKPKIKRITEQEQGQLIILAFWFLLACDNYSVLESVWLDITKNFELQGTLLIQNFLIGKPTSSAVWARLYQVTQCYSNKRNTYNKDRDKILTELLKKNKFL